MIKTHNSSTHAFPFFTSQMDNVKEASHLFQSAQHLIRGFSITPAKLQEAKELFAGAQSFWKGLQNRGQARSASVDEEGLGEEHFIEPWAKEGKDVWMFSGCRDNQTSADTSISGAHVGGESFFPFLFEWWSLVPGRARAHGPCL